MGGSGWYVGPKGIQGRGRERKRFRGISTEKESGEKETKLKLAEKGRRKKEVKAGDGSPSSQVPCASLLLYSNI